MIKSLNEVNTVHPSAITYLQCLYYCNNCNEIHVLQFYNIICKKMFFFFKLHNIQLRIKQTITSMKMFLFCWYNDQKKKQTFYMIRSVHLSFQYWQYITFLLILDAFKHLPSMLFELRTLSWSSTLAHHTSRALSCYICHPPWRRAHPPPWTHGHHCGVNNVL